MLSVNGGEIMYRRWIFSFDKKIERVFPSSGDRQRIARVKGGGIQERTVSARLVSGSVGKDCSAELPCHFRWYADVVSAADTGVLRQIQLRSEMRMVSSATA